jgi:hypothetical protein
MTQVNLQARHRPVTVTLNGGPHNSASTHKKKAPQAATLAEPWQLQRSIRGPLLWS